jgi:hypothetical protein
VTVKNAAAPINATVTGAGFAIYQPTCGATQAIGTCTIGVTFAPTAIGNANGVLTVGTNSVSLSGVGQQVGQFTQTDRIDLGTLLVNATASAVVTITPNTPAGVTGLVCTPSADLTLATQTCAATGAITAVCTLTYTFKASTPGVKNDSVTCSAAGKTSTTAVAANVVTPSTLAINPSTQIFTSIVGQPVTWTFNVSNSGGSPTGTLAATISAGGPDFAITSNDCVVALPSLGVCKIQVTFTPVAAGPKNGTLTVADATPGSLPATATLTGTGIADKQVVITPATSDFGSVKIPAVKTTAFTMTNNGGTATDIVALAASDATFVIASDLCSGRPLAAKGSCTFAVTFTPAGAAGLKQAMVNATQPSDGAILASAAVSGTVVAADSVAKLVFSPPTLDFGTTGVGVSVGPYTFTVTNTGGTATGALSVVKNDSTSSVGGASQFSYTSTCTGALAAGASCQLVVTFTPTIDRSASAVLTVSDNLGTASAYGTVTGIALPIPNVGVSCGTGATDATSFRFPATVVGQSSDPVVCTISNNNGTSGGETPQATGAITPTVTGPFSVGTNNCTASLAPGLTCTMTLVFTPTAKGEATGGMLTITTANRGADNLTLYGKGLLTVEIVERISTATTTDHIVTNYDFGQVSLGATSTVPYLTLDVYVRGAVGNLAITGTDLKWNGDTAASDFVQKLVGTKDCAKLTNTAPTPDKDVAACTLLVAFNPQSKTALTNTVTAKGANGTASDTATMKGTGTGPLTIAPSPLTFDAVAVGSSSSNAMSLKVCNNAPAQATAATLAITGPNASDFALVEDQVSNLNFAAGPDSCKWVVLRLDIPAGAAIGARSATVTVTATVAGVKETATGQLVGSAVTGAGLTAALGGAFAATAITNVSAPVVLTVTNSGSLATDILVFNIPESDALKDFFLTDQSQYLDSSHPQLPSGTCSLVQSASVAPAVSPCLPGSTKWCGVKLDPGVSCTTNIWFKPNPSLGIVQRNSTITVSSKVGGMQVLDLTAKATSQLTLNPASIDLGASAIDGNQDANPTKTITLINNGGKDIPVADILPEIWSEAISQTGLGEFSVTANTCSPTLGKAGNTTPPSSCILTLQSKPTGKPGPRAATLEILNSNGGTQKATAVISSTAVMQPKLVFSAASVVDRDFGRVMMGATSLTQTFTVTNVGGLTPGPVSFALYDLDASGLATYTVANKHQKDGDFVKTGTCTGDGATLAPGQSCNLTLAFHPTQCPTGTTSGPLCPDTGSVAVQLLGSYTTAGNPAYVTGPGPGYYVASPKLWGTTTASTTGASLTVAGVSPYDFEAGPVSPDTTKTVTITVSNSSSATAFTLATPAIADVTETGLGLLSDTHGNAMPKAVQGIGSPATSEFAASDINCSGKTLTINQTCTFLVTWTPNVATLGTREVKLSVGSISMSLFGRVLTAANLVAISNTPLEFGDAVLNTASPALTMTIQNQGELATETDINVVASTVGSATERTAAVTATGCKGTGSQLAPGATCILVAKVTPTVVDDSGTLNALDIVLAGKTTPLLTIQATWTGVYAATLNPTPAVKVTFHNTAVLATSAATAFTLANPAASADTGPLSISVDNDNFAIVLDPTVSTCLAASHAFKGVTGNSSCIVSVVFRPTALATPLKGGNLLVTSTSGATATCPLAGTAIPALSVSPVTTAATATANASFAFAATSITAFVDQEFTIYNVDNTPGGILAGSNAVDTGLLSTSISGGTGATPDQFKIVVDNCVGVSLAGSGTGQYCTLKVRFAPTSVATGKNAVLTITDPASGTPADSVSVNLKGDANP